MSGTLLNAILISISLCIVKESNAVPCNGSELSIHSASDVFKLTEKRCTVVTGDIIIRDIKYPVLLPAYWSIEKIIGSLIILNTEHLKDSISFQNLRKIEAGPLPAIAVVANTDLQLGIGARLANITSQNSVKCVFVQNGIAPFPLSLHQRLSNAAEPAPVILLDAPIETPQKGKLIYIFFSFVFTTSCIGLFCALLLFAAFGRILPKPKKD